MTLCGHSSFAASSPGPPEGMNRQWCICIACFDLDHPNYITIHHSYSQTSVYLTHVSILQIYHSMMKVKHTTVMKRSASDIKLVVDAYSEIKLFSPHNIYMLCLGVSYGVGCWNIDSTIGTKYSFH